jgi:ribosome-associated protein
VTSARDIEIPEDELEWSAIRAQGAGGQNVNKVATAVQLKFDVTASRVLTPECKDRLLALRDHRISSAGVVVIKAQQFRSQEKNKEAARERLREIVGLALVTPKARKPTKPTRAARTKRLEDKTRRGRIKRARSAPTDD